MSGGTDLLNTCGRELMSQQVKREQEKADRPEQGLYLFIILILSGRGVQEKKNTSKVSISTITTSKVTILTITTTESWLHSVE